MVCANRSAGVIIIEIYTTNYLAVFLFFFVYIKLSQGVLVPEKYLDEMSKGQVKL